MSRESEIAALLQGDTALMAILTGGIYASGDLTPEGITREVTPPAFDADGYLRPIALVKQRGDVPTFEAGDFEAQITSANVVVEIWLYEDITFGAIDAAKPLIYRLLQGVWLPDSYEIYLANTISRQRDSGALDGASMERLDYVVPFVMF